MLRLSTALITARHGRTQKDGLVFVTRSFLPRQRLPFEAVAIGIQQLHIQITRLDLVHAGACRVGEPRKRCADQHGHAEDKRDDAREQFALRAVSGFHM